MGRNWHGIKLANGKKLALNGKKLVLNGSVLSSEEGKDEKISSEENKPLRRTRRSFNYRTSCSVKLQIFCSLFKYGNLVKKFCIHVPVLSFVITSRRSLRKKITLEMVLILEILTDLIMWK